MTRKREVGGRIPRPWYEQVRRISPSISAFLTRALADMLASGKLCVVKRHGGDVTDVTAYVPDWLYEEVLSLVKSGVYKTKSGVLTGAVAKKLGLPCDSVVKYHAAVAGGAGGNRVNFADFDNVRRFVARVLAQLADAARGAVVHFDMRQACRVLSGSWHGNCLPPAHSAIVYRAVEDLAGDCVVADMRVSNGRKLIIDRHCLEERLVKLV